MLFTEIYHAFDDILLYLNIFVILVISLAEGVRDQGRLFNSSLGSVFLLEETLHFGRCESLNTEF